MKELILQALSRFLYKLRGLFVEKTELKKYAKKPNKRYIVGRAMALHPMVGDRYFFQTGMVKMRVDKAFVQALAENTQIGMSQIEILGHDSQLHSPQVLLAEAEAYEQRHLKKWSGVMVIFKTTATIKRTILLSYRDGCSIDTLTEAVRNGSGELKYIVEGQVWMNNAKYLSAEPTCKDLHIKAGRVTCTKTCEIQGGGFASELFVGKEVQLDSYPESVRVILADGNKRMIREKRFYQTKKRDQHHVEWARIRLRRVQPNAHIKWRKVVITPICRGRKGIPEYFFLRSGTLKKSAII